MDQVHPEKKSSRGSKTRGRIDRVRFDFIIRAEQPLLATPCCCQGALMLHFYVLEVSTVWLLRDASHGPVLTRGHYPPRSVQNEGVSVG